MRPRRRRTAHHVVLLTAAVAAVAPSVARAQTVPARETTARADTQEHVWLGPDGAPLPFCTDDEIREFLRTARVVHKDTTEDGITRPAKLLLEADGVQAHAILRQVDVERRRVHMADRFYPRFLDSYALECAAYALARRLGLGFVPPVVLRKIGPKPGSVQIWVEKAHKLTAGFRPASPIAWVRQTWDQELFDNLILNVDRNTTNILVGQDDSLWAIDHTRAFQPQAELLCPDTLQKINRGVWDRLQAMSDDELMDVVREYLDPEQLQALVRRRALLVEHVQRLVAESGEEVVFY